MDHRQVLISISGRDSGSAAERFLTWLASRAASGTLVLEDLRQRVDRDLCALSAIATVAPTAPESLEAELAGALGPDALQVTIEALDGERARTRAEGAGEGRWLLTLLTRSLDSGLLPRVAAAVGAHGLRIEGLRRRAAGVPSMPTQRLCLECALRGTPAEPKALRRVLLELARAAKVDLVLQRDDAARCNRRFVAFDMDSTLIEAEVIDELAARHGIGDRVAAITERAMRGELDFGESFRARVALLEGLSVDALEEVADALRLTEGAERLLAGLKARGYRTAILSGGFEFFARRIAARLGIDHVHANALDIEDGQVTGRVRGTIVDGARKAALLRELADAEGLTLEQVVAVGDGANDLPMLALAGLGVAFRAKPLVQETADHAISEFGLDAILDLLGCAEGGQDLDP